METHLRSTRLCITAAALRVCANFGDLDRVFCRLRQLSEGWKNLDFLLKLLFVVMVRLCCMMVITDTDKTKNVSILGGHFFFCMGVLKRISFLLLQVKRLLLHHQVVLVVHFFV